MCQMRGAIREENLLKNAKGRPFYLSVVQRYSFLKVQVVPKPFTCPRGKSLSVECHPLDDQIVWGPITASRVTQGSLTPAFSRNRT